MDPFRNFVTFRNVLICAGIYYVCGWLSFLFSIGYDKLTQGMTYFGDFEGTVFLPLIEHFPRALFAAAAGAAIVYFVQSDRPIAWSLLLAAMYAGLGFRGYHWARPPLLADRVEQTISAFFPAVACVLGAVVARRYRPKARPAAPIST